MKISPVIMLMILAFVPSCVANQNQPQMKVLHMEEVRKDVYYYIIPNENREVFLTNIVKVDLGDSPKTVIKFLGEPTYDQVMMRKEKHEVVGRKFLYYFKIYEKGLVNEKHDRLVSFWFNKEDKLTEIATNVEEILNLNSTIIKKVTDYFK